MATREHDLGQIRGMTRISDTYRPRWSARAFALLLALLGVTAAACGSSSSTSSGTTSTTASVCNQAQALKTSVQDLKNVDVVKNGTSALSTAAGAVKSDADALAKSAKSEMQPDVQALQQSLQQLDAAVKDFSSGGITPVLNSATAVSTTANTLVQKLDSLKC